MRRNNAKQAAQSLQRRRIREAERASKNRQRRPDKERAYQRRYLYGLDQDDYNKLFAEQGGRCAICGRHQSELGQVLNVDHVVLPDGTMFVRGLLCGNDNRALGLLRDSSESLARAIAYLKKNERR